MNRNERTTQPKRKLIAVLIGMAASALFVGGTLGASPVSASSIVNVSISCDGTTASDVEVSASPGDTLRILVSMTGSCNTIGNGSVFLSSNTANSGYLDTPVGAVNGQPFAGSYTYFTVDPGVYGNGWIMVWAGGTPTSFDAQLLGTNAGGVALTSGSVIAAVADGAGNIRHRILLAASPSPSSSDSESFTHTPIVQQFGKPASLTCDAVAPVTLNWSGVASGGWSESWEQWMNNGNGGAVCTRTLVYSTAQSKWVVG